MEELGKVNDFNKELPSENDCLIDLESISVKWPESDKNTLSNLTFNCGPGQLFAIVGHVGSGKVLYFYDKCISHD
jgi:ABC-type transport system involved in cytochrome bd biosynthesis fused ATPase/permease subunit